MAKIMSLFLSGITAWVQKASVSPEPAACWTASMRSALLHPFFFILQVGNFFYKSAASPMNICVISS
jgi:hypothetical protein